MGALERRGGGLRVMLLLAIAGLVAACGGASAPPILSTVGGPITVGDGEAAPSAAPAERSAGDAAGGPVPANPDEYQPSAPRDDLKIVYTGSLQLVVDDLATALAKAKTAVLATGGYIGASQESNDGDKSVATVTYRIPADRWEDAIAALRGLAAKVVGGETQATEVGGQVVDLEARIRNLEASEASLQEIAKGAGKVSDLLEVQAQLTDVRGQIEQLEGQLARLNDQVAFGTMVATFGLQTVRVVETAKGWDPTQDVDGATATLVGAGQALVSALIWFGIVWLPLILVIAIGLLIARLVLRRVLPKARSGDPVPGWDGG